MNPQHALILRYLLAILGARLATKGWLEAGQQEAVFVDYAVGLVGAALSLGAVFAGRREATKQAALTNTALALPAYSTPHELRQASMFGLSGGMSDVLFRQALASVFTLLRDQLRVQKFSGALEDLRAALDEALPPARGAKLP